MGSQKLIPTKVLFEIKPNNRPRFALANTLRLIRGETKEEFFNGLLVKELETPEAQLLLSKRWVRWTELESEMRASGFNINRTAMWNYKTRSDFAPLIRTDGIDVVWDLEGILNFFKGEKSE